jgi:NAD(P)H-hydrate epimerase
LEKTTQDFLERLLDGKEQRLHGTIGFVPDESSGKSELANLPPLVVDADGLKLLARLQNWHKLLPSMSILTPHPGEMSILCGMSVKDIQADRLSVAKRFAEEWGHIVVLKGAFTVIAKPTGDIAVIPVASAALARAGTGDVLAGTIVGLRAQGVEPFEAAVAGAWIHGKAGLSAARELRTTASVLAGDVLANIPKVLGFLERGPIQSR